MLKISKFTGGIAQTNGYLVGTSEGDALAVDAPLGMAKWLKSQGVNVTSLLLTHQHFDHVDDAARIKAEYGCRILAYVPFSRDLTLEELFGMATGLELKVPAFEVDEELQGLGHVQAGGIEWQLEHIPGHSPDSVVFISRENRLVFGGDVLFEDGVGRCDFPGGSMEQLITGIESKLMVLPDDFTVYPGHGRETTVGRERKENPYLAGG